MSKIETPEREDPTRERLQRDEPPPAPLSLATLQLAQAAAHLCAEKKGESVQILDVTGSCGYADVFVIASGLSERQTLAIAKSVDDSFRKGGVKPFSTEGLKQGHWALIDYGDLVVHVFLDSAREYYDLEGFWSDGRRVEFDENAGIAALAQLGLNRSGEPIAER